MEYDAKTIWTFALIIAAALAYRYVPRWTARSPFVDPREAKDRLDAGEDIVILDVRSNGEFNGRLGHIPGAVHVPMGDLRPRLMARDRDLQALKTHPIYVHCLGEGRAARCARFLRDAGFTDVSVIKGGIRAWHRRGYAVERRN